MISLPSICGDCYAGAHDRCDGFLRTRTGTGRIVKRANSENLETTEYIAAAKIACACRGACVERKQPGWRAPAKARAA